MVLEPDHAGLIRALRAWAREANPEATLGADAADALVALLADARRYRWLRANARVSAEHWQGRWSLVIDRRAPRPEHAPEALDAALDAAADREPAR